MMLNIIFIEKSIFKVVTQIYTRGVEHSIQLLEGIVNKDFYCYNETIYLSSL